MIPSLADMLSGKAEYKPKSVKGIAVSSVNKGIINLMKLKIARSLEEMDLTHEQRAAYRTAIYKAVDGFVIKNKKR